MGRSLRPLSALRHRSFLPDPQDPEEDFLSDHFLAAGIPEVFFQPIDFSSPPSLNMPCSTLATDPASTPHPDPPTSPTPPSTITPLSPYASLPLSLSPSQPLLPSPRPGGLIVTLALSFERQSDRHRIIQLLRHFAVVISVTLIPTPLLADDYDNLQPYFTAGRYIHVCQDFSVLHRRDNLSPTLSAHMYLSPRVVSLDYYHLASGYYPARYGVHWFSHPRLGLPGLQGTCHILLQFVTDIFLPRDKGGDLDSLRQSYHSLPPEGPHLSITPSYWNPLTRSDFRLTTLEPSLSPTYHLAQYLLQPPFFRIHLSLSVPIPVGHQPW